MCRFSVAAFRTAKHESLRRILNLHCTLYAIKYDSIVLKYFWILTALTSRKSKGTFVSPPFIWIHVKCYLRVQTYELMHEPRGLWTRMQPHSNKQGLIPPLSAPSASGEAPSYLFSFRHWTLALLGAYCCSFSRMAEESPLQGVSHTTAVQSLECMWGAYQFCKNKVINTWWVIVSTRKNKY